MTGREKLHLLVDKLDESIVPQAVDLLNALNEGQSPVSVALANAAMDDEPGSGRHRRRPV